MTMLKHLPFSEPEINELRHESYTEDWPVVYMLENGTEAYIGETVSARHRLKQHKKNPARSRLSRAHIIIDDEFNKSATLDIESWLIQYIAADDVFKLQNGNAGLINHSYYNRESYEAKFEVLWSSLQKEKLAHKDLVQLRNSDIFKFSPYKALTDEQQAIVRQIERNIANGIKQVYRINGEPGTGKSVLATYLAKYLVESREMSGLKIGLVIPMVNLRKTLTRVFKKVEGLSPSMVLAPNQVAGQHFDVIIVDEAHRLRQRKNLSGYGPFDQANAHYGLGNEGNQLDWLTRAADNLILFFDEGQSVMPGDIPTETIKSLPAKEMYLTSQLRVLGGGDYISMIDSALNAQPTQPKSFMNYEFRIFDSVQSLIEEIKLQDKKWGLARVVAGYAWPWLTAKGTQDYDIDINGLRLRWNSVNVDWVNSPNAVNEVGCIHTIQGCDLTYAGVIIGPELTYDKMKHKLVVHRNKYMDINGKRGVESAEELERYIINIYKTLMTRGIRGTYVYAVDEDLREYLKTLTLQSEWYDNANHN